MQLLNAVEKITSAPNFYWQSLAIIACFVISYFFYHIGKQIIFPKINIGTVKKNLGLHRFISKYINPLIYPLSAVFFLAIGLAIYGQFFAETTLFFATLKLVTLFLFIRFLRLISHNNFIANVAALFLMPSLILDTLGLFQTTIDFLDQYALKIGTVRISIYLVMKAFIVFLTLFCISNLIIKKSKSYIDQSTTIKSSTKGIIAKFIDIMVYSTVFIVILKTFGVDMTTFAVLGGAIGVGIGFGLQKIASNFISGIILLFEKSVEVGDWVELDGGKTLGIIKYFGGRYTLIEQLDGKELMVPNEELIINKVTNLTYSNNRARIEVNVRVAYDCDLKQVENVLMNCAAKHPRCLNYPEIECYVTNFGESSIDFILYFWVSDLTRGRMSAKSEVMKNIHVAFKEHNILIPFPQHDINVSKKNRSN